MEALLARYYHPYHRRIQDALRSRDIKLALDCHSMAAVGPPVSPDTGLERPTICLGNDHGRTCPPASIEKLVQCFRDAFRLQDSEVAINRPFAGAYITRTYGGKHVPWVQVEISRALYLQSPWFDDERLEVDGARLGDLRRMIATALANFFGC